MEPSVQSKSLEAKKKMQASHFPLLANGLLDSKYAAQAEQNLNSNSKLITKLLGQRKLPEHGWTDAQITSFLNQLALLDSNNGIGNVGVGEREGRVFSRIVQQRHYGFMHGACLLAT